MRWYLWSELSVPPSQQLVYLVSIENNINYTVLCLLWLLGYGLWAGVGPYLRQVAELLTGCVDCVTCNQITWQLTSMSNIFYIQTVKSTLLYPEQKLRQMIASKIYPLCKEFQKNCISAYIEQWTLKKPKIRWSNFRPKQTWNKGKKEPLREVKSQIMKIITSQRTNHLTTHKLQVNA